MLSQRPLHRRCLITAVAAPADAPGTTAALSLSSVDPPADTDADAASAAPAIARDSTVPYSAIVALGRYAVPRLRRPWPLLPLTPQFPAPDNPAHAVALYSRPLLTASHLRLLLLPLPLLEPLALLRRPDDVLVPAHSQRCSAHANPNVLTRRPSSRCRSRSRFLLCGRSRLRCYRWSAAASSQAATCPPQAALVASPPAPQFPPSLPYSLLAVAA